MQSFVDSVRDLVTDEDPYTRLEDGSAPANDKTLSIELFKTGSYGTAAKEYEADSLLGNSGSSSLSSGSSRLWRHNSWKDIFRSKRGRMGLMCLMVLIIPLAILSAEHRNAVMRHIPILSLFASSPPDKESTIELYHSYMDDVKAAGDKLNEVLKESGNVSDKKLKADWKAYTDLQAKAADALSDLENNVYGTSMSGASAADIMKKHEERQEAKADEKKEEQANYDSDWPKSIPGYGTKDEPDWMKYIHAIEPTAMPTLNAEDQKEADLIAAASKKAVDKVESDLDKTLKEAIKGAKEEAKHTAQSMVNKALAAEAVAKAYAEEKAHDMAKKAAKEKAKEKAEEKSEEKESAEESEESEESTAAPAEATEAAPTTTEAPEEAAAHLAKELEHQSKEAKKEVKKE